MNSDSSSENQTSLLICHQCNPSKTFPTKKELQIHLKINHPSLNKKRSSYPTHLAVVSAPSNFVQSNQGSNSKAPRKPDEILPLVNSNQNLLGPQSIISPAETTQDEIIPDDYLLKEPPKPKSMQTTAKTPAKPSTKTTTTSLPQQSAALECLLCEPKRTFTSKAKMYRHKCECHPSNPTKLQCKFCGAVFKSTAYCAFHQKNSCKSPMVQKQLSELDPNLTFFCEICDPPKGFKNKNHLGTHNSHYHPKDPSKLKCKFCGVIFKSTRIRQEHEKTACARNQVLVQRSAEKKYECNKCQPPKSFSTMRNYKAHRLIFHPSDLSRLKCRYCGLVCKNTEDRRYHEKNRCPENPNPGSLPSTNSNTSRKSKKKRSRGEQYSDNDHEESEANFSEEDESEEYNFSVEDESEDESSFHEEDESEDEEKEEKEQKKEKERYSTNNQPSEKEDKEEEEIIEVGSIFDLYPESNKAGLDHVHKKRKEE